MKVLLINNIHTLAGGANTVYFNTGELLKQYGHEVLYFAMHSSKEEPCDYSEYFVKSQGKKSSLSTMMTFVYNRNVIRCLTRLINEKRPDVAHLHLIYGGLTSAVIKVLNKSKIPIVYTVHDYRLICPRITLLDRHNKLCDRCRNGHFYHCLVNRCYKGSLMRSAILTVEIIYRNLFYNPLSRVNAFIFVSHFGRQKHIQFEPQYSKVYSEVLYNFLNDNISGLFNNEINTFNGYYLYYGRLAYEKGLETLIRAFAKYPNLKLHILGSGPLKGDLYKLVSDLKANNISFCSHKTGKDLFDIVRRAKYICMPSEWYEMLGMTIIEGNSLGIPSIASDIGGLGEIVEEGVTGFKFKSGDIDSLCSAIDKASSVNITVYETLRKNVITSCHAKFDSARHYEKLLEIYHNAINAK